MAGIHYSTATSTGGTATVTLPATTGVSYDIQVIALSYIGFGTAVGRLTVTSGNATVVDLDVPTGSIQYFVHDYGIENPGDGMEVKLQCGAQSHTAKLSITWQSSGD
jgi:hypothetical protein